MKGSIRRILAVAVTLLVALAAAGDTPGTAAASGRQRTPNKLDLHLRTVVEAGRLEPQRVIVRARPGARAAVLRTLGANGGRLVT